MSDGFRVVWHSDYEQYFRTPGAEPHKWVDDYDEQGTFLHSGFAVLGSELGKWAENYPRVSEQLQQQLDASLCEDLFNGVESECDETAAPATKKHKDSHEKPEEKSEEKAEEKQESKKKTKKEQKESKKTTKKRKRSSDDEPSADDDHDSSEAQGKQKKKPRGKQAKKNIPVRKAAGRKDRKKPRNHSSSSGSSSSSSSQQVGGPQSITKTISNTQKVFEKIHRGAASVRAMEDSSSMKKSVSTTFFKNPKKDVKRKKKSMKGCTLASDQLFIRQEMDEAESFADIMEDITKKLAAYYNNRKVDSAWAEVSEVMARPEWNKTFCFGQRTVKPSEFLPRFTTKDIGTMATAGLLSAGQAAKIWPAILELFQDYTGSERATRMTELWDELCSKIAELSTLDKFIAALYEISVPLCDWLAKAGPPTVNGRTLTRNPSTGSNASDGSDDMSWLKKAAEAKTPQIVQPKEVPHNIPANIKTNIENIAACTFYKIAPLPSRSGHTQ